MHPTKELIQFDNFSFTYDNHSDNGVHDINLSVSEGEFILFTGPSGCGKTTLTRCINGLIPDFYDGTMAGSCRICGMELSEHETGDFASHVGSVFQDPRSQFFTLHVNTELPFPSENLGIPMEKIQASMSSTIADLQMESLLSKSIFALSSGEKQKVAIASVYTTGVDCYVLDEPSANLDFKGTEQLKQILSNLKEKGYTIVISEHKLYYLRDLIDRVVYLDHGKIQHIFSRKEFQSLSDDKLSALGLRQIYLEKKNEAICSLPASPSPYKLQAKNLSFHYKDSGPLWKEVSFECHSGEIVGILGKNGAGKSTLIRVLMGLEKPKTGKISLCDSYSSRQQRRKKSFYVMQDVDYQFFAGTVLEEMTANHPHDTATLEKARKILKHFSLDAYESVHPSTLSGGQKQRLSIALSCMSESPYLYFDEPTSGLDATNMKLVRQCIKEQAQQGKIIFVITHDYEFAASLFTSLLVVQKGEGIRYIPPEQYHPETLLSILKEDLIHV